MIIIHISMKLSSKLFSLRELLAFHFNRKSPNWQTFGDLSPVANILQTFKALQMADHFSQTLKDLPKLQEPCYIILETQILKVQEAKTFDWLEEMLMTSPEYTTQLYKSYCACLLKKKIYVATMLLQWIRIQKEQFAVYVSDTPVTLKQGQG